MAMNPQYIGSVKTSVATISTANTAFDGAGAMATVFTAGQNGARIERVSVSAAGTTTAGVVNLFVSTDSAANNAANTHIYDSVPVAAVTPSATVAPFQSSKSEANASDKWPLILGPGQTLRASTTKAENFRVVAVGGDY